MRIGIDLMGGDTPTRLLFPAIAQAAQRLGPSVQFVVFATPTILEELSSSLSTEFSSLNRSLISFHPAAEVIGMEEEPLLAVRRKADSSLVKGIAALNAGDIDAFVSCGNTGALIAEATLSLPHMQGVLRPGLLAVLPTENGNVAILDVGGNVACKAEQLVDYARLGAIYSTVAEGIALPKVGLLNIGAEPGKGTEEVRKAYRALEGLEQERHQGKAVPFQFCGNIEGREIFHGLSDVIITDGFSGNVMLKTAEGVAAFIFDSLEKVSMISGEEMGGRAYENLKRLFDYTQYRGALICGLDALVFKVHGNADAASLLATLLGAADCLSKSLLDKMRDLSF